MSGPATFHSHARENSYIRSYNTCGDNASGWLWAETLEEQYRQGVAISLVNL